jgi:hypothetical protein
MLYKSKDRTHSTKGSYVMVVARVLGGALLAATVVFGGLLLAFHWHFHPGEPPVDYAAPKSALEAQRQDLDYFTKVMALDRAFSPAARAAAAARLHELGALAEALPSQKLQVALMQVMALADNGHSRVDPTANGSTLILPVRVTPFAEGFYVMRVPARFSDLVGGRVDSIDGHTIDQILSRLETLRGGVAGFRRQNAAQFMVVQDLLYGLGVAANPNGSTWTVTRPDGQVVTRQLDAAPLEKGFNVPEGNRWLAPQSSRGLEKDWIAHRPRAGDVPETWRNFDNHFRLFPTGHCAEVVRLQNISDTDGQQISPFLASTEAALRAHPPCAVIVDLRGNGGGDYTNTWHFAHVLPQLIAPSGHISVLTDSATFSAAITTAAFIKAAGGNRVTLIGEPVGDRLSFFSEGGRACLPNLKVCVHYQTGKHDYGHACNSWGECYWLNWLYPVRVDSLQPDRLVPLTFADWDAGRDRALSTAAAL